MRIYLLDLALMLIHYEIRWKSLNLTSVKEKYERLTYN